MIPRHPRHNAFYSYFIMKYVWFTVENTCKPSYIIKS